MGLTDEISMETKKLLMQYPDHTSRGGDGVRRLAEEMKEHTGRDVRPTVQSFDYYLSGDRLPDKFFLYFVWVRFSEQHPIGQWARACLSILAKHGRGLPGIK
jgi:hypothetical protein